MFRHNFANTAPIAPYARAASRLIVRDAGSRSRRPRPDPTCHRGHGQATAHRHRAACGRGQTAASASAPLSLQRAPANGGRRGVGRRQRASAPLGRPVAAAERRALPARHHRHPSHRRRLGDRQAGLYKARPAQAGAAMCGRPRPATAMAAGTLGHGQNIPDHWPGLEAVLGSGLALAVIGRGGRVSRATACLLRTAKATVSHPSSLRIPKGILLNLSGYGYRVSAERGVEVGTLAEV